MLTVSWQGNSYHYHLWIALSSLSLSFFASIPPVFLPSFHFVLVPLLLFSLFPSSPLFSFLSPFIVFSLVLEYTQTCNYVCVFSKMPKCSGRFFSVTAQWKQIFTPESGPNPLPPSSSYHKLPARSLQSTMNYKIKIHLDFVKFIPNLSKSSPWLTIMILSNWKF